MYAVSKLAREERELRDLLPERAAETADGKTSPEELIAAAHTECLATQFLGPARQPATTRRSTWLEQTGNRSHSGSRSSGRSSGGTTIPRPGLEQRRVNVDFPSWMIESLDREARRLGVTRQSIIKVWIAERLERGITAA
jgi:hypothetical protein